MSSVDDVAARLRRLEDRHELTELVQRYCLYTDRDRWDDLAALFADDIDFAGATGRDAVIAVLRKARESFGRTVHTAHGVMLDWVDDDHATGIVPTHAELVIGGTPLYSAMRYVDTYVRERGAWKIGKRRVQYAYVMPWETLAAGLTDELPIRWPGGRPKPANDYWS